MEALVPVQLFLRQTEAAEEGGWGWGVNERSTSQTGNVAL